MKTLVKTRVYPAILAMLLIVVVAGQVAATKPVPFHGSLQGVETQDIQGTTAFIDSLARPGTSSWTA